MKLLLVAILLIVLSNVCAAQNEFSNVAVSGGLIFNTRTEGIALLDNKLSFGQFAVSDREGRLLFYGDASYVYDRNGTLIYCSSEHRCWSGSTCVAVNPKNDNQYYIFTSYYLPHYKEYDNILFVSRCLIITDNNGVLTIEETKLNEFEDNYLTPGCCFARIMPHADGKRLWLLYYYDRSFVSCLMDDGIIIDTVKSPSDIFATFVDEHGEITTNNLKTNPAYNMIVLGKNAIVDFDQSTGKVNVNDSFVVPDNAFTYDFSPLGKYFYSSTLKDGNVIISRHKVSDLNAGIKDNGETIFTGRTIGSNNFFRHFDSVIYIFHSGYISKIENPDSEIPSFTYNAVALPKKSGITVAANYLAPPVIPCVAPPAPRIICE